MAGRLFIPRAPAIITARDLGALAPVSVGSFPGQLGNPVGFAATPASPPPAWTGNATWPGAYPGSLTAYGGGDITSSGTAGNYLVFSFLDFNTGTAGQIVNGSFIKFIGCRFQQGGASGQGGAAEINGGSHHEFYYCTQGPLVSQHAQPPNGGGYSVWPTAGVGKGITPDLIDGSGNPNTGWKSLAIPYQECGQYAVRFFGNGNGLMDHCDIWGFGNYVVIGTSNNYQFQDCWVHDCQWCGDTGQLHCDGIGYIEGAAGPQNVTMDHCTIAAEGVEDGAAWQASTSGYTNLTVTNNYFTGWDYALMLFSAPNSGVKITDNTFGTEVPWTFVPASATNSWFTGSPNGNVWRRNKLKIYPGTSDVSAAADPKWDNTMNGYYIYPDGTYHATDFS